MCLLQKSKRLNAATRLQIVRPTAHAETKTTDTFERSRAPPHELDTIHGKIRPVADDSSTVGHVTTSSTPAPRANDRT